MVVLPNEAPAQETSERWHLSDGVGLVTLEDRQGRGGEEAGMEALSAEQEATLASGNLRCQKMRFWNGDSRRKQIAIFARNVSIW